MKATIKSERTFPKYLTRGKVYEVEWDIEGKSIKFIADNGVACVDQIKSIHVKGGKWLVQG